MTNRHANFISKQKEKIAELQDHNKELVEEARNLQEQIDAMTEEKDRMGMTGTIQDEEIKRLTDAQEGNNDV